MNLIVNFLLVALFAHISFTYNVLWPVSGSFSQPDLPQSSPFGPRLKASESFRYDWHRGVDIPTPIGTPLLCAMENCSVRISGVNENYEDPLVQLKCGRTELDGSFTWYYVNYLHMNVCSVAVDARVQLGDVVGLSGVAESGFEHLHLEIRRGGVWQRNCINPWAILPFNDTVSNTVSVYSQVPRGNPGELNVTLLASQSANELDLDIVQLELVNSDDEVIKTYKVGFQEFTYDAVNASLLDNPIQRGIEIHPAKYSGSSATAQYALVFFNVTAPPDTSKLRGVAIDLTGHRVEHEIAILNTYSSFTDESDHISQISSSSKANSWWFLFVTSITIWLLW